MRALDAYVTSEQHFRFKEFVVSNHLEIPNTPNEEQWGNIEALVKNVLDPLRNHCNAPLRITSGFRSEALNKAVGGSSTSNHLRGEAADFECADGSVSLFSLFAWIHDNCDFQELIAEQFPRGWIHVAYRQGHNAKQIKRSDAPGHCVATTFEDIKGRFGPL